MTGAYADLDLDRTRRRGYPEAVYCAGKTPEQVAGIAAALRGRPDLVSLFTRATPGHAAAVQGELPDAFHDDASSLLAWPPGPPRPAGGPVAVLGAGFRFVTVDLAGIQSGAFTLPLVTVAHG